jgi:CelD/BcsL family acetyltransferase involved in cellulose biosynthesis
MSTADRSTCTLELVQSSDRYEQLVDDWERLAAEQPTPFTSHAWFGAWWSAFGKGNQELRILLLWEADELVAAYPLCLSARKWSSIANVHSPVFTPLARDSTRLQEVSDAALRMAAGRLTIESMPDSSPAVAALKHAAAAYRARTITTSLHVSPIVDTSGEFAAWRADTRHLWGAPLERFRRKMLREHNAEIRVVDAPADLEAELQRGFAVEASGWKGRAKTAILSSAETEQFYRRVAVDAHARDELRLSWIMLDGEAAAFDLTLLRDGRLYLLKTGFDERHRRLAPGLVLRLAVIERCFELGLRAHELLGGDTEWKRKFATTDRRHVAVDVFPSRPLPLAAYAWRRSLRPRMARGRALARAVLRPASRPSA